MADDSNANDDHSTSTTGSSASSSSTSSAGAATGPPSTAAFTDLDATIDSTNLDIIAGLQMEPSSTTVDDTAAPSSAASSSSSARAASEPTARPVAVASALKSPGKYAGTDRNENRGSVSFQSRSRSQSHRRDSFDSDYSDNGTIQKTDLRVPSTAGAKFAYPLQEDDEESEDEDSKPAAAVKASPVASRKAPQSQLANKQYKNNRLTKISKNYDFDGDGVLNEAELAMRRLDTSNRGYLTNQEIYALTREQIAAKERARHLKKLIAGMVCLGFVLALSNLGTSLASAILAEQTKANRDSESVEMKSTGEIVGYQAAGETFEVEQLEYEERRERRKLVSEEIRRDPLQVDHAHRRLGKSKNAMCECQKISFDGGKMREKDLLVLKAKCDGSRTVNIKRKFRDGSTDTDTICRPGVTISVKGRKKRLRGKDVIRIVDQEIVFEDKRERKNKKGKAVFSCERGWCYTSGELFQGDEGEPCDLDHGSDDCLAGLHCYTDDITDSVGVCTRMVDVLRFTDTAEVDSNSIGGWYIDYSQGEHCVRDCAEGLAANCGGLKEPWTEEYATAELCCDRMATYKRFEQCVRDWPLI